MSKPTNAARLSMMAACALFVLCAFWAGAALSHPKTSRPPSIDGKTTLDLGDRVKVDGTNFSLHQTNLLIASSISCTACQASRSFYQRVRDYAQATQTPLYVVQTENDEVFGGDESKTPNVHRLHIAPSSAGIFIVPTFATIDRSGIVKSIHIGIVSADEEESTIKDLITGNAAAGGRIESVTPPQLDRWRSADHSVQVIDVREPGEGQKISPIAGALQIPRSELSLRSRYELDAKRPVIVDCRPLASIGPTGMLQCQDSLVGLRQRHFVRIAGIDYRRAKWPDALRPLASLLQLSQ